MKPLLFALLSHTAFAAQPFQQSELIIPLEKLHNHSSCVVELPNKDLYVCWYNGSGERTADDVKVEGARLRYGSKQWTGRITLADTPGFPDTNPAMFLDSKKKLWLLWPVILANEWHTALMKYRISSDYKADPRWEVNETMHFIPRNFAAKVKSVAEPRLNESPFWKRAMERSQDKYFIRMGWMTRAHPLELPSGRIIVPLYSDGVDYSLMAITDDRGKSWTTSEPLVGIGSIQPSVVRKRDGTLVAYMRDNGPPPKRVATSYSQDDGITWSPVVDTDIPNPGSGMEAISMHDGTWAMIYNDLEKGRHSLSVSLSDDEGKTWKWKRHVELDKRETGAGQYHYPSIIQAMDGTLHATYSYYPERGQQSIKHANLNVEWVKQGDR